LHRPVETTTTSGHLSDVSVGPQNTLCGHFDASDELLTTTRIVRSPKVNYSMIQ
jgi:hypothetical protein